MTYEDYLEHHGILGQKWGVRRYQNYDGSLTELGKKRYASDAVKGYGKENYNHGAVARTVTAKRACALASSNAELKEKAEKARNAQSEFNAAQERFWDEHSTNPEKFRKYEKYEDPRDSWFAYVEDHSDMKKLQKEVVNSQREYDKASEKYFSDILGEYGKTKVSRISTRWDDDDEVTIATIMANASRQNHY